MSLLADGRTHDDISVIPDAADGGRARRLHLPSAQTVVALVAGLFIVMYAVVALLRLRYPYELEWIEGGMVNHVAQIRAGHSLYGPPSVGFTPDIYTPLYYVVAAGVTFLTGIGFFSLRLVSLLASFALLGALAKLAHRETDSPAAALVAAGLFAATYRIGGAWLDIAREDTLCLALLFWGMVVARDARTARRGLAAGVLISLAFLTKQVALLPAIGIAVFLLIRRRGRGTIVSYLATVAVGIGGSSVVLDWITHGWYGFYVWKLPSEHQVNGGSYLGFFTDDLLVPLAVALVVGAVGLLALRTRRPSGFVFHAVVGATVLAAAYSARLHTGGYDNVLLPAYAEIAVLFAIGVDRLLRQPKRAWLGALVAVLCLLQFGHLWYSPTAQIPNHTDVALGDDTLAALRALPKPIYLPGHPWYLHEIDQPTNSQAAAIGDVLRAGGDEGRKMAADLWEMVRDQKYASIVVDSAAGYSYLPDNLCRYYEPAHPLLSNGQISDPITGTITGPAQVWLRRAVPADHDCDAIGKWTVGPND